MIESTTPKKWVSDKDERLLGPGEMIFAQNVIVSERGGGSVGVIKTMKGTTSINPVAAESGTDTSDWEVAGSVADNQRNYLYLFVNDEASGDSGRIVRVDSANSEWQTVLSNGIELKRGNNVVGTVINKAFQQDGVVQTVLYFTDNHYQPYKINVDRALAGDYDAIANDEYQRFAMHTIKAAAWQIPNVGFETDENFNGNNFKSDVFQFAVQYIYKDGEESALSGYSKLAVSPYLSNKGTTLISKGSDTGNVCVIGNLWGALFSDRYADVTKVRLLARIGNNDPFYVIDDFDPRTNKTRYVGGNSTVVYDSTTYEYKFYNDQYYTTVSQTISQKLYDNVPQKAEGQTISGNRLMYSNYEEGYPNVDLGDDITFTVTYGDDTTTGGVFHVSAASAAQTAIRISGSIVSGETPATAEGDALKGDVFVDLTSSAFVWPGSNNASSTVPAGTVTRLGFTYQPRATYYKTSTAGGGAGITLIEGASNSDGDTFDLRLASGPGDSLNTGVSATSLTIDQECVFLLQYTSDTDEDVDDIATNMRSQLSDESVEATMRFTRVGSGTVGGVIENSTATSGPWSNGNSVTFNNCTLDVTFGFNDTDVSGSNDGDFVIEPYVKRIKVIQHDVSGLVLDDVAYTDYPTIQANVVISNNQTSFGSPVDTYVKNGSQSVFSVAPTDSSSFKAGSSHDFGIVFFDQWGRSGFVNEIGSAYIDHTGERAAGVGKGASQLTINFPQGLSSAVPDWAYSWAPVYGGSQFSNVLQYTTGGGYVVKETASPYAIVDADKRIYVSLNTLVQHKEKTSSTRDYSFTKGDICRVISYKDADTGVRTFPSTNESGGGIIEFEVLGVETLTSGSGNPIEGSSSNDQTEGQFLVLRAPEIEGGFRVDTTGDGNPDANLKYEGFDWFSMTGAASYPVDVNPNSGTATNYWGQECVIELLTPKKSADTKVYYEFGVQKKLTATSNPLGANLTLIDGDVRLRTVSCVTPEWNGVDSFNQDDLEDWVFVPFALEDQYPTEISSEKAWNRGRAHVKFDRAATVNRYNSITYSDPYADDTAFLTLSSFTPANANFFDLPSEHGACKFIGMSGDNLMALQENKVSRLSINKSVIETGTQSGLVSLAASPVNNLVSYSADFGTQNPESVTIRDGVVYFADVERSALVKVSQQGMTVMSDMENKSTFDDRFDNSTSVVSGFDPEDDIVFFTFNASGGSRTFGWDEKSGAWTSVYTFIPEGYATLRGRFYALGSGDSSTGALAHEFNDEDNSNVFMGRNAADSSRVHVVFNDNPNRVKHYQSISIEGDMAWTTVIKSSEGTTSPNLSFEEKEGVHYAYVGAGDSTDYNDIYASSSKYLPIGEVESVDAGTNSAIMKNSLRGVHIPIGYNVAFTTSSAVTITDLVGVNIVSVDRPNRKITFNGTSGVSADRNLYCFADGGITGDKLRGNWARAELEYTPQGVGAAYPSQKSVNELHAINAYYKDSKANHALGNQ